MKNVNLRNKKKKGVALIICVGILSLIAIIATSFAINMQIEYRAAANFMNYTVAKEMSESGLNKTVADIRALVANSTYDVAMASYPNPPNPSVEVSFAGGSYTVTVEREDQKININALDETDYPWIAQLISAGLLPNDIAKIIAYRGPEHNDISSILGGSGLPVVCTGPVSCSSAGINPKNAPYATIEELRLVLNDNDKYNAIKDLVTVYAPVIPGGLTGKYYSSGEAEWDNTAILDLSNYRGKIIEFRAFKEAVSDPSYPYPPSGTFPGADGNDTGGDDYGWAEAHDGEFAGGYIAENWTWHSGLDYFGAVFTGFIYIPNDKVNQDITFKMRSKDGVRLFIDGTKLIEDWNDRDMGGWPSSNVLEAPPVSFNRPGWHAIRIEYYNRIEENTVQLKWDAYGSDDYVPSEYLGHYPSSYYGDISIDGTSPQAYRAASRLGTDYNSAGILKIVSTGRAKRSDGTTILAEKKTTSVIQVFNTLTQSTRAEFWAAWFSNYNDFSDGEVRNVTWLDSCPTDQDSFDILTGKMHWEGDYQTTPDSVKLGYWDNFNDDVAYSAIMTKGGYFTQLLGISWWDWGEYKFPATEHDYWLPMGLNWGGDWLWPCTFGDLAQKDGANDQSGNPTYCLRLITHGYVNDGDSSEERQAEVNSNYYKADAPLGYDVFVRSWVFDNGWLQTGSGTYHQPPSKRIANPGYPNHIPEYLTAYLVIKTDPPYTYNGQPKPGDNYYTFMQNGSDWMYSGEPDANILYCPGKATSTTTDYYSFNNDTQETQPYVLAAIGKGSSYQAYNSYTTENGSNWIKGAFGTGSSTKVGGVAFRANNLYYVDLPLFWWGDSNATPVIPPHSIDDFVDALYTRTIGISDNNPRYMGSTSESVTDFDNARTIYQNGYIVSAPLIAKIIPPSGISNFDNSNIIWDTITWNDENPDRTSITMYARADDNPSINDDFSTTYSKGDSIASLSGGRFQYKALLHTEALDPKDYSGSSVTPVLKGVTVMYHRPKAQIFYQQ